MSTLPRHGTKETVSQTRLCLPFRPSALVCVVVRRRFASTSSIYPALKDPD